MSFKKWLLFSEEEIIFQTAVIIFYKCFQGLMSQYSFHHIYRDSMTYKYIYIDKYIDRYTVENKVFDKVVEEILEKPRKAGVGG